LADHGLLETGFNRKTYSEILEDMEARARSLFGEDINLSERSPLGLWLRTTAWEKALLWEALENSYLNAFVINANGIALDNIVSNKGMGRRPATKAKGTVTVLGDDGTVIPIGFRFATRNDAYFVVTEQVTMQGGSVVAPIEAEEAGEKGNVPANTITKIVNPIAGVREVTNEQATVGGSDVESDVLLRKRYLMAMREPATGDNATQYRIWAQEVPGIGNVRVKPAEVVAPGHVRVIVASTIGQAVSQELVDEVQRHLDSVKPVNAGVVTVQPHLPLCCAPDNDTQM
jgi:uncharacterized phage protein gp47/JayE